MSNSFPNVSGALASWFQPLIFLALEKTLVDGLSQDRFTQVTTSGVVMPLRPQQLAMKPEGERSWIWKKFFCLPVVKLNPSDEIIFGTDENGDKYRIMAKADYSEYGYIEYEVCQGYQLT
jgi:hypothetical protein